MKERADCETYPLKKSNEMDEKMENRLKSLFAQRESGSRVREREKEKGRLERVGVYLSFFDKYSVK